MSLTRIPGSFIDSTSNLTVADANLGNLAIANYFSGDGSLLINVGKVAIAESIANGTSNVRIPVSNGNITLNVGGTGNVVIVTSTGANVTGNLSAGNILTTDAVISGNLTVNGTTTYVNTTITKISDPIVELGGGSNGAALSTNDSKDRGQLLHYYSGSAIDAFMGWDNSNAEFAFASNVSVSSDVVTFNNLGNIRASTFIGTLSGAATTAGTVTTAAQPNITSVGALSALEVNGNIISGNANLGNLTTSNYFHGLFDSTSGSQPNITSVGTLTSLAVTGNISAGNLSGANLISASYFHGLFDSTSNNQPNITTVGTLSNLTVAGTITPSLGSGATSGIIWPLNPAGGAGDVASIKYYVASGESTILELSAQNDGAGATQDDIYLTASGRVLVNNSTDASSTTTGSLQLIGGVGVEKSIYAGGNITAGYFIGNGSQLTGLPASYANSDTANYLLTYTGNLTAGNANLGNAVTANYFIGNGSQLTGLPASYANSNVESYLPTYTGNLTAGNATLGNLTTSNYFSGNGSLLTAITGANVTGTVATATSAGTATTAATVTTAAQPNITSVGTLSGLISTGTIDYTGASNVSLGAVGNIKITGGTSGYVLSTNGSGVLSWVDQIGGLGTTVSLDAFTGNGVQTSFTLSSTPSSKNYTVINIDGVSQLKSSYSLSGNVITLSEAPPASVSIEITTFAEATGTGAGGLSGSSGYTYVEVNTATAVAVATRYIVNTSTTPITLTLPIIAVFGDEIGIIDGTGNASTNNITINRNGSKIQGLAENMVVTTDRAAFTLVYYNTTQGWLLTQV